MRRNNALVSNHFKKSSLIFKNWFDKNANKERRRERRIKKAKMIYPMPLNKLKPVVRCRSARYNWKERYGKGFTFEECKSAGLDYRYARTIGISVDSRRRNTSKEAFDQNVLRIKEYLSKIVIYKDRKEAVKSKVEQYKGVLLPIRNEPKKIESISVEEILNY
ncbi:ribosomal protein L13 [Hamiltosporidium tvaerminnensis]|uniref:Ribosomal protein L13 n=2 Tax=Hamiltosporidium TaxID=1176354 RepID=A0A4V2JX11_9MICR|nr:ribosomal protein L13 [Hamiltosporidium tvaerminnensis]TBU07973.1 ribosomal protein L13 [Hamiltosporidium magnivora]TBU09962.1 ribosomal protein L13 [Hamiltosporidium magnivora]TBU20922.1 ribosomal protein L13 [Hamiltosporidium tvaerminnensis]